MTIIGRAGGFVFHRLTLGKAVAKAQAIDLTPDMFSFADVFSASLATIETSNTVAVAGLTAGVSVAASISGDASSQLQKNGGAWRTAGLTVQNGDTLAVRHTSSALNSTAVSTTLTVGGVSDTFTSTTLSGALGGKLNFSLPSESGLLALLEDV